MLPLLLTTLTTVRLFKILINSYIYLHKYKIRYYEKYYINMSTNVLQTISQLESRFSETTVITSLVCWEIMCKCKGW